MQPTNWHVITGAPCSGKTAVVNALQRQGFEVVHEVARALIDEELQKGRSLKVVKQDIKAFEQRILDRKLSIESQLSPGKPIYLDRALPDSIAYYRLYGIDPREAIEKSRIYQYKKVFLFERLFFEKDQVRSEDEGMAAELERLLAEGYESLGYSPVKVPLMPVDKRVDFVLNVM